MEDFLVHSHTFDHKVNELQLQVLVKEGVVTQLF
jgi:hypothetical protein